MITLLFLAFVVISLIMLVAGLVIKWLSGLVSPALASTTGVEVVRAERFVQTVILLAVTFIHDRLNTRTACCRSVGFYCHE